jgi:hypothetical protein
MIEIDPSEYGYWCERCEEPNSVCRCDESDEPDGNPEHEWGCCFPDRCLMPGEHMKSECHDVEMVEAQEAESRQRP